MLNELREVQNSRDSLLREVSELKVQLKIVEDTRDELRRNLQDANQQLHKGLSLATLSLFLLQHSVTQFLFNHRCVCSYYRLDRDQQVN